LTKDALKVLNLEDITNGQGTVSDENNISLLSPMSVPQFTRIAGEEI
jgi:hypothetical protein